MKRGKLITIEGVEGAGKSTALEYLKTCLSQHHIEAIFTREPGGTIIAERIRYMLLHAKQQEPMFPETELLLMFAARAQHIKTCILPALSRGEWVVSDRFIDASYAYQGGGRNIQTSCIDMLDQWIVNDCYPDLTLLLDINPDLGLMRADKRQIKKDRIEHEQIDFFNRVREIYLKRAQQDPGRIKIIDASANLESVTLQIKKIFDEWFEGIKT